MGGREGVVRSERAMIDGIEWIGEVVAGEEIDCGWVKSGAYRVATSAPQLARAKAGLEGRQARGYTEDDARFVTAAELGRGIWGWGMERDKSAAGGLARRCHGKTLSVRENFSEW